MLLWSLLLLLLIGLIPALGQGSIDENKVVDCTNTYLNDAKDKTGDKLCDSFKTFVGCVLKNTLVNKPTADVLKAIEEQIKKRITDQGAQLPCAINIEEIADKAWNGSIDDNKLAECINTYDNDARDKTGDKLCDTFKTFVGCVLKNTFARKLTADELKVTEKNIKKSVEDQGLQLPCAINIQEIADKAWSGALKTSASLFVYILGFSGFILFYFYF